MFKAAEMQRIRVTGLRSDLERVIKALHEMGDVEFRKTSDEYFEADAPLDHFAEISKQLVRMRGIESMLKPQRARRQKVGDWRKVVEEASALQVDAVLRGMIERREQMRRRKAELTARIAVLKLLAPLDVDLDAVQGGRLAALAGTLPTAKLKQMEERAKRATRHCDYTAAEVSKGRSAVLLVFERQAEAPMREGLAQTGLAELSLEGLSGKPKDALMDAWNQLKDLELNAGRLEEELERISRESWARVVALREALEIEEQRCIATRKFGRSARLFAFEGWIVKSGFGRVEAELQKLVGNRVLVERLEGVPEGEKVPTKLLNPAPLEPFEYLVNFISVPASNEIDPTPIFAITFPILYGMMLGDVGSGLVSVLIAWWLLRRFKNPLLQVVCKVWMFGSISAILFGIAYDEWFGFSHAHLLGLPEGQVLYNGMHRLTNTTLLLGLVILVGAFHIFLGFLLGFVNAWRRGDMKHAAAKLGWMGIEVSGILLVLTYIFNMLPAEVGTGAAVLMGISILPMVRAEGLLGIIEIPSLAGNILSYARVMAIGLAGVVIAEEIINKMAVPDPATGIMFFLILPIFIVLQLLHIFIDMFEALVQGARLNLVEFFSKFYHGGGVPFNPFRVERKHTAE